LPNLLLINQHAINAISIEIENYKNQTPPSKSKPLKTKIE
jgi:hypothetical protein